MANVTNSSDEIVGVSNNNIPTGTYTDASGTHPYADIYGGMTYDGATNTKGQLTLTGIDDNTTVTSITVTDTVTALKADGTSAGTTSVVPVTVTQNGSSWQATTANSTVLPDGDHTFTVTFKNAVGTTVATETYNELVRHSTGGNAVPTAPALTAISDSEDPSGTKSPNIIPNHGVTFSGTADAYALINVYVGTSPNGGGQLVADQVQADSTGHWTVVQDASRGTLPETPGQLTYVQVIATDLAGNSAANGTASYVVDTTNPTLAFTAVNYTDSSGGSHDTNVSPVTFSGTVSDDHTVDSVVVNTMTNGVVTGHITATVNADGTWTASGMLGNEGTKSYSVTATDEVGNTTTTGNATTFVYDHTPPIVSANLHYTNTDLTHSTTVDQTSNGAVTFTAVATDTLSAIKSVEVFDTVTVNGVTTTNDLGAEPIVSGTGAAGTNSTYGLAITLGQGTHVIHEVVTDIAGNATTEPSYTPLIVDTTAPTITSTTETYGATVGTHATGAAVSGLTNDPTIHIAVTTTDAGGDVTNDGTGISSVQILDGSTVVGNATYSGSGNVWTYDTSSLSQGTHTLHAVVTDAVGNVTTGANLAPFTIDTVAPAQPTVALTTDSGSSHTDNYTNPDAVTVTAEAGSTVSLYYDGSTTVSATATASGTSVPGGTATGTVTVDPHFADGAHSIVVTATDAAGNVSTQSTSLAYTVDTVPPVVTVTNTSPVLNADSGATLNASHSTATFGVAFDETPKNVDGSAHSVTATDFTFTGGTITSVVQGADAQHYTVTVQNTASGNAITDTLTYKAGEVYDQAGNANVAASATATGDTQPPAAPVITNVDATLGQSPNALTTAVTVSGTVEANAVVTIYDAEQHDSQSYPVNGTSTAGTPVTTPVVVGTGKADATGHYSIALSTALTSDETHVLSATATDAASNVSVVSATAAAAVMSPEDTYSAASAINKGVAAGTTTPAIAGAAEYFVVGDASTSADLVNGGRTNHEVINDESTYNSTITVGASQFTLIRGGEDASITAGSGVNVFQIGAASGASLSPSNEPQAIHGFNAADSIDVSQVMTTSSSIEIDQTATGSVLVVRNDVGGGTTMVNLVGSMLTPSQVITATADHDYYLGGTTATTTASLFTSVALDGTRTEVATGDARTYSVALQNGTGYIAHGNTAVAVTSLDQVTFADGTLSFNPNSAAAEVYRIHMAAYGTTATADDLATGVTFLSSGHTINQLATSYLASQTLMSEASLTNQQFVDLTYQQALGRAADASGEASFTNLLNTGALGRGDVIAAFAQSSESHLITDSAVTHGLFAESNVTVLYEELLGRDPTSSDLSAGINSGLNDHDLAAKLMTTQEFNNVVQLHEGGTTTQNVVEYLYENILHRAGDAGGLQYWTNVVNSSPAGVASGEADVLEAFKSSGEASAFPTSYQQAINNGAANITAPIGAGELVKAIFGSAPAAGDSHFTSAVNALQQGATLTGEAQTLIASNATLTNDSTASFVNAIYTTALGRGADAQGAAFWTDQIDHHGLSKAAFVTDIINTSEFQSHFDPHAAIVAAAAPAVIPS